MNNLENAVKMAGSVKNLCKYFDRHKDLEPYQIVEIALGAGFDKATFKEAIKGKQKEIDEADKVTSYSMVLFSHPDIGKSFLAGIHKDIVITPGWTFQVDVDLVAKSGKELRYGLDNPRILQKIKDAGDFRGMMGRVQSKYRELVNDWDVNSPTADAELERVEDALVQYIELEKDAAIKRATKCASEEFGKKADIKADARSRAISCGLKALGTGLGVMASIAAVGIGLPAALVTIHGTLKGLDSTVRAFRSSYNGFEFNMQSAESCYKSAGSVVNTMRADAAQIGARVLQTAFGEISNSFAKGEQFLTMATADLNKIDDKANDVVAGLNKFIVESTEINRIMEAMESELDALKKDASASSDTISKVEKNLAKIKQTVSGLASNVDGLIQLCVKQSTFVNGCQRRIDKVVEIHKLCKPSTGAVAFIKFWDGLELVAGVLGGGFAAGGGFTGEKLVGGLNPMNEKDWITVGNFTGHTNALMDTILYGKDIYDTVTQKEE